MSPDNTEKLPDGRKVVYVPLGIIPTSQIFPKLDGIREALKARYGEDFIVLPDTWAINVLPLTQESRVVFTVDCGNLPPEKAREYLSSMMEQIKNHFPNNDILATTKNIDVEVQDD